MSVIVSALKTSDRKEWEKLYYGYADFYQVDMNQEKLDTVWSWIFDGSNPFYALIAKDESGKGVGLMHYRQMPSPLRAAQVGFLDDLFVSPDSRGTGVVNELYAALQLAAEDQGWPFVRWITADNNYRGRSVYDKLSSKTHWVTYQMDIA